jgi:hypothetical protein
MEGVIPTRLAASAAPIPSACSRARSTSALLICLTCQTHQEPQSSRSALALSVSNELDITARTPLLKRCRRSGTGTLSHSEHACADTQLATSAEKAQSARLDKVCWRHKLRSSSPVEEAVDVGQRQHAPRSLQLGCQKIGKLRGTQSGVHIELLRAPVATAAGGIANRQTCA